MGSTCTATLLTPYGGGAIGVIRVRGSNAWPICTGHLRPGRTPLPVRPASSRIYYGHWQDGATRIDASGKTMMTKFSEQFEQDAHGNVQLSGTGALGDHLANLIRSKLGEKLRVRADTFGYMQRSFAGCTSSVDALEAREAGRKAANLALAGEADGSVSLQRSGNDPYRVEYHRVELADVAARSRTLDPEYLIDSNDIAPAYRDYLTPLVGKMPVIELLRSR